MKRLLSVLVLTVASLSAEPVVEQRETTVESMKNYYMSGPVGNGEDNVLARTDFSFNHAKLPKHIKHKSRDYHMYSFNSIQPIHVAADSHSALFGFGGVGISKWDQDNLSYNVGVGYRHLTACGGHLFGIGANYKDVEVRHTDFRGPGAFVEWSTHFTTTTLSRSWDRVRVAKGSWKHYLKHHSYSEVTGLDFAMQVPYLPWAQVLIGKTWREGQVGHKSFKEFNHFHHWNHNRFDYGMRVNVLGCLAVEAGRQGTGAYTKLIFSYGRPAKAEFSLADGFLGQGMFTESDLRTQMLSAPSRSKV